MPAAGKPSRGEVWWVDVNPTRGHEQASHRPALVVSVDAFNHGPAGMIVVAPLTWTKSHIPLHVEVPSGEAGLPHASYIKCEDVRSISQERLVRPSGMVSSRILAEVEDRLRILLGL